MCDKKYGIILITNLIILQIFLCCKTLAYFETYLLKRTMYSIHKYCVDNYILCKDNLKKIILMILSFDLSKEHARENCVNIPTNEHVNSVV